MTTTGLLRGTVLVFAVAVLTGCGGGSRDRAGPRNQSEHVQGVGITRAGSTAQFADCRDWRPGTVEQRRATIRSIRDQMTPQRSATAESALSDDAAYRLFDKTCASGVADTLRLYKLYARAQAFAPFAAPSRDANN